jgi:tetratricopeptide (TPR) repeat protein
VLGKEHPHVATSLNNLAELYREQGQLQPSRTYVPTLLGNRRKRWAKSIPMLPPVSTIWQSCTGHRATTAKPNLYTNAPWQSGESAGQRASDVATSLNNLAELYKAQGNYSQAEPLIQRSLSNP